MEILLAMVVASAVIFFGALISMGNERQRRAIDSLREQVVLWALQDLRIKRQHLAQSVRVDDPLGWLNKVASNVLGHDLKLQVPEVFEEPPSLVCMSGDGTVKIIFSPLSPADLHRHRPGRRQRLSQFASHHPLWLLPKDAGSHELSILNEGQFFDLEFQLTWKAIAGREIDNVRRVWLYTIATDHP